MPSALESNQALKEMGVWPFASLRPLFHELTRLKATHESPAFSKRLETLLAKADPQFLLRFAMCPESKSVGCRFATPRSGPSPAKLT